MQVASLSACTTALAWPTAVLVPSALDANETTSARVAIASRRGTTVLGVGVTVTFALASLVTAPLAAVTGDTVALAVALWLD
jgi:hypothetical protein